MKASEIQQITDATKKHIIHALEFLYEAAELGDNRLELKEHAVEYANGDYKIVAVDMEFEDRPNGRKISKMVFYNEGEDDWQYLEHLSIEVLHELLSAVEKVVKWHYETPFELPAKKPDKPLWLFIGTYPNAYIYADQTRETRGDYHTIAAVYFRPLSIKVFDNSPQYSEAIALAKEAFDYIKEHISEPIVVSATGQTVLPYIDGNNE